MSELWPHLGSVADDICVVRSMWAEIPNHEPCITLMNTGANLLGRPSMGSWITYGLGTENENLPGYVVLTPTEPLTIGSPLVELGIPAGGAPGNCSSTTPGSKTRSSRPRRSSRTSSMPAIAKRADP